MIFLFTHKILEADHLGFCFWRGRLSVGALVVYITRWVVNGSMWVSVLLGPITGVCSSGFTLLQVKPSLLGAFQARAPKALRFFPRVAQVSVQKMVA